MSVATLICILTLSHFFLLSESKPSSGSCDWRYYQHYKTKGCSPVIGRDGCPTRFDCKPLSQEERQVCHYKGRKYHPTEQIENMGPCDHCQCSQEDPEDDAFISCAVVDCPDMEPRNQTCYMGHSPDSCCPKEICPPRDGGSHTKCEHLGVSYRIGDYVPTEDPCKACICTEDWTGIDGPGCSNSDCITDQYAREIRDGCLPVYHEKTCCPFEVNCGKVSGATPVTSPVNRDNFCFHEGKYYELGSVVYLEGDKYGCHPCTCSIPPDFTCVQKACQPAPKPGCKPIYGHCCPQYECP